MSYNTRAGVRSNRPGYANSPASNNANYNQNQYQNQNTTPSYTQPAYSTPTNYGQNKQPFSQNTPTQQQQTPAKGAAATVQHIPHTNPPPPPAKEVVQPPPAPAQQPEPKQEADVKGGEDSMDTSEDTPSSTPRGPKFRPWNKRGPAAKISRKLKKRRQNARLRNLLAPKNAMMVLHELHPELKMVISEQVNAANQTAYTVEIEVEGKLYRGHGMSKMAAKQVASENALKAVLLEKLEQNNLKINPDNTLSSEGAPNASGGESQQDVPMKEEAAGAAATAEGMEGEDGTAPVQRGRRPIEDDVPWGSLASFALFKLFAEWQSQGFQLPPSSLPPVFHKGFPTNEGVMISKMLMNTQHTSAAGAKKIPEDANKKHPVQLLNQIRPGSQYSESREGQPPNLTFKFTVQIDGQTFQGVGTNKRDAKKECAKRALEALGVKYE